MKINRNAPGCKSQQLKLLEFAKRTHSEVVKHKNGCGGMPKLVKWQGRHWNDLVFGANDVLADVSGTSVGQLQEAYREVLNLPSDAFAYVDGQRVESNFVVEAGQRIEWMRERGQKGANSIEVLDFKDFYGVTNEEFDWCEKEGMEVLRSKHGPQTIAKIEAIHFARLLMEQRSDAGKPKLPESHFYDEHTFTVKWREKRCHLGNTIGFSLFKHLADRPSRYVDVEVLKDAGWGHDEHVMTKIVHRQMSGVRKKLTQSGISEFTLDGKTHQKHYALLVQESFSEL